MHDFPLWSLFLSAFISSTLLPGGSEAVLAYLAHARGHELWLLLAVAAAGNTLGGMTSWGIGRLIAIRVPLVARDEGRGTSDEEKTPVPRSCRSGSAAIELSSRQGISRHRRSCNPDANRISPRHSSLVPRPSAKAVERLRRWGAPVLLLSWLPIIGDPLCVAAGWLRIHWLLSLVLIGIGKTARYAVVVFLFM